MSIAAFAVLLAPPLAAQAKPTYLICKGTSQRRPFTWQVTLNETASTASVAANGRSFTVLAAFGPDSVTWTYKPGKTQMAYYLNRLTGDISHRMIVPSNWSKKDKESWMKMNASGQCNLREVPTERKF